MSEEIIKAIDKILNRYIPRIKNTGKKGYNKDLDSICSCLLDLKFELEKRVIKGEIEI